ncbi:abc superfamily atp binding cassette transporter, abc protein [Paucilactobacillus oligofermentans DSM 15707 = LMG 22743]|uniref:Abc superfamily atp binding cassette transporter, abc protein n=1 Tax=Paucilactobacillus oligofermentans DSM 15707 = LMG 22743 TaxID=1423778 RepID=A0A0R1RFX0_9LACO|nr:ABC transporter ATP-binding protein [Paucilactobacillus oligofermentans]KRL55686.1 abc superfamily atp binding cassette transporter, abc protein [Paucilactobacillus oligofermentans DSM 15707 = LMG 22743]CUS25324.1 Bacitracin transport ATP binding cassette transporter [Paucilactobacillus oligofermentans DSM 15707 = LMG 22743]
MKIIEAQNISKKYKANSFYSLKDINFSIETGDIVGLIGKNGSGKSTLLKLMAKAQKPTTGTLKFKGIDISKNNNILDKFGIMIEPIFYPHLTVYENLMFFLEIHKKEKYVNNIKDILELVDLWNAKDRKPVDFSFGMKQRLSLALSLIAEPEFMILDEPFVGLDPLGVKKLIEILQQWSATKHTSMIISSHQLNELEDLCNRYIFIDSGRLKTQFDDKKNFLIIRLDMQVAQAQQIIASIATKYQLEVNKQELELPLTLDKGKLNDILEQLSSKKLIEKIYSAKDELESYFTEG